MTIYINNNTDKAAYADQMFSPLVSLFGGNYSDYYISTGDKYLRIETTLATEQQLSDFVANFQPVNKAFIQKQLANAKRGLFIQRKFKTILDKVEIKTWLT